jgi:hypothetical protein
MPGTQGPHYKPPGFVAAAFRGGRFGKWEPGSHFHNLSQLLALQHRCPAAPVSSAAAHLRYQLKNLQNIGLLR